MPLLPPGPVGLYEGIRVISLPLLPPDPVGLYEGVPVVGAKQQVLNKVRLCEYVCETGNSS